MDSGWTSIYFSNYSHKAEIVRAVLLDHEIESVLVDKRDSSYVTIGEVEVYVRNEDAILAKLIIEQENL